MKTLLPQVAAKVQARWATRDQERGDVVQWVLIALMSAAIMAVILVLAKSQLQALFNQAMQKAAGAGG